MRRVSWNIIIRYLNLFVSCHASHEACELKYRNAWNAWISCEVTPRMRRVSWNRFYCRHPEYCWCHASHEACELKYLTNIQQLKDLGHASHEACELKYTAFGTYGPAGQSRLAWGVWVEILQFCLFPFWKPGHALHEACELKWQAFALWRARKSHASHEACELKFDKIYLWNRHKVSRLAWGVWVEIYRYVACWRWHWCHASHEACELKCLNNPLFFRFSCHASHEACELKLFVMFIVAVPLCCHASHEACELKYECWIILSCWK